MSENFGWYLGYGITIAVVLVVVALVVPILVLAYIDRQRGEDDQRLAHPVGAQHRRPRTS